MYPTWFPFLQDTKINTIGSERLRLISESGRCSQHHVVYYYYVEWHHHKNFPFMKPALQSNGLFRSASRPTPTPQNKMTLEGCGLEKSQQRWKRDDLSRNSRQSLYIADRPSCGIRRSLSLNRSRAESCIFLPRDQNISKNAKSRELDSLMCFIALHPTTS